MKELFKFEVIVHFDGDDGAEFSINEIKAMITMGILRHTDATDVEIDLIERSAG